MQISHVTTPFGRRPMTLALVKRQQDAGDIKPGKTADKWKVFRNASAAMNRLGLQPNSLAVLDALLSFYPETELRQGAKMIVFPSNNQLALRAHGMAGATLRRHLAVLVDAGLIIRKDSANGKRYARKSRSGEIETAFGFDLSPLLERSEELALLAQQVAEDRAALRHAKENLTICRRDIHKLITAALEEGLDGRWQELKDDYSALVDAIPRTPSLLSVTQSLNRMELLRRKVLNELERNEIIRNDSTNHAHNEQHIQNSESESLIELEPALEGSLAKKSEIRDEPPTAGGRALPLDVVLKACPSIGDYSSGGSVCGWRDLMSAAVVVRSALGVTPDAYQDACAVMGPENAAVAMACILERATLINSAGGYLRDLTRRARLGEFSLGPMVMAQLRAAVHQEKPVVSTPPPSLTAVKRGLWRGTTTT